MKKYCVTLTEGERADLGRRVTSGRGSARELSHARILLKADWGPFGPGGCTVLESALALALLGALEVESMVVLVYIACANHLPSLCTQWTATKGVKDRGASGGCAHRRW